MYSSELSGLVLTHGNRNPSAVVTQLALICDQVVIVHDNRAAAFDVKNFGNLKDLCDVSVLERPFDTFPAQRNAGIEKALGSWVISIDSDELVSSDLRQEISGLQPPCHTAIYEISRKEIRNGRELKTAHPYGVWHPRLFRADKRYADYPVVHEELAKTEADQIGRLSGTIQHWPDEYFYDLLVKAFEYGRAERASGCNRDFSWLKITSTIPNFMLRRGFWRDGKQGLALAGMQTAYRLGTKVAQT